MAEVQKLNLMNDLQSEIKTGQRARSGVMLQKFSSTLLNMIQTASFRTKIVQTDIEMMLKTFENNNGTIDFNQIEDSLSQPS